MGRTVRLIVIDPISDYMGDTDTHKETAVRGVLSPLSDFASKHDVAIVCVAHPPKVAAGGKAVNAITGAKAFVGASRIAWLIAAEFRPDPNTGERAETGRVLFLNIKRNIGRKVNGLAFRIEEKDVPTKQGQTKAPYVVFDDGDVSMTADDMLKPDTGGFGRKPLNKIEQAKALLSTELGHGPQEQNQLIAKAKALGISYDTLNNARKELKIESVTQGFQGLSMWTFPGAQSQPSPGSVFS